MSEVEEERVSSSAQLDRRCREALDRAVAVVGADLTWVELEQMRLHLEHCENCDCEVGLEVRLRDMVRRSCCESAPETLRLRIVHQITVEQTRRV